jgi:hypothetical protein
LLGSKSSGEAKVSFAHCLDIHSEQSSTVVGTNCEKWLAMDGLTYRLLTSVNLELPSKSWSISRKGKWTISWPDTIVVLGWGVGTFFLIQFLSTDL